MFNTTYEITKSEWDRVQSRFDKKNEEINQLLEVTEVNNDTITDLENQNRDLVSDLILLKQENCNLQRHIKDQLLLRTTSDEKSKATLSVCLENLNECFTIMERHGLSNRKHTVTSLDLVG